MSSLLSFEHAADSDVVIGGEMTVTAPGPTSVYTGPDRRRSAQRQESVLQQLLDEIDYGVLVLSASAELLLANHAARLELAGGGVIGSHGGQVRARLGDDTMVLHEALLAATRRDKRCMVQLGSAPTQLTLAIIPLAVGPGEPPIAAALLGRQAICERLSIEWFARLNGMTLAETRVLGALSQGARVKDVAEHNEVELSTIRTQVGALRAKAGADSLGALMTQLAMLPPLRGALRSVGH